MAQIALKGNPIHTNGDLPAVGSTLPSTTLTDGKLGDGDITARDGIKVLNIFPSIDTGICQMSVRAFHERTASLDGVTVLNISADLPFAQGRFCASQGIENAANLSSFRSSFAQDYGVEIIDGPMRGLCARAVIVVDASNTVLYTELVPEIVQEPNYDAALAAAQG